MGVQEDTNQIIDLFVPTESIGANKSVLDDFLVQKKKKGFRVNIDKNYRLKLLPSANKFYNELYEKNHKLPINDFQRQTVGSLYIIPIKAKYLDIQDDDYQIDTLFVFDKKQIKFSIYPYKRVGQFEIWPVSY